MKSVFKPALIAALLSAAAMTAFAQTPGAGPGGPGGPMMGAGGGMHHHGHGMGKMDPASRQAMADKRLAQLKEDLKLTPTQEGAWTTFASAMKPPADPLAKRPDPAEMAKLSTPERIDKMKTLRAQHMADMMAVMDKLGDATKAFYATLTPEQKAVFDVADMQHRRGHGGYMGGHGGGHGGGHWSAAPGGKGPTPQKS